MNVKGQIITTDAMGCQIETVRLIRKKQADYVLALKGSQGTLYDDIKLYFSGADLLTGCSYTKVIEKARGGIEKRPFNRNVFLTV